MCERTTRVMMHGRHVSNMKPFACLLMTVLFVFSQQPAIRAAPGNPLYDDLPIFERTVHQQALLDELTDQIGAILKNINSGDSYEIPLDEPDPPLVHQNFTDSFDEGEGGTLYLRNTAVDGLSQLADRVDVTTDKMEIRIKAKLKKLDISGEYIIEGYRGAEETGSFNVLLSHVEVNARVSLIPDASGTIIINKITPVILSEETYISLKSGIVSHAQMITSVMKHVRNTIRNRLTRVANLELLYQYPRIPSSGSSQVQRLNQTLFEARKYVDRRYNPYKLKMMSMAATSSAWHMGPFNLYGFSNFFVDELDLMVNNNNNNNFNGTTIDVIIRIIATDMFGRFPLFLQQKNVGDYTVKKAEFIAKLVLYARPKSRSPLAELKVVVLQMTNCFPHIQDSATGQSISNAEFGFDIDGLFCLLLKNDLSMPDIIARIQEDILNKLDDAKLKPKIHDVIYEDRLLTSAY